MAALGVDKRMLRELESMGFPTGRATRALYYSGSSSIEDAINWVLEHEDDSDIDQIPQVPIDIKIESGEPLHSEDVKMKLKDLREQAQKRREEEEKRMEREQEKERIRRGKRLMEDKRSEEKNERQRIIAFRKAEKEEEKRARQKIRQQLELDKAERRRRLGLPAESPGTLKLTPLLIQEGNVGSKTAIPSLDEPLKDCLRSLKKNHKDDDAKVKKAFQTLLVYVANVVRNPDNEKYRKIRLTNPLFQDRVGKFKQGIEFLELCGFHKLEGNEFLFMPRNSVDMKALNSAGLALNSALTNPFFGMLSL